MDFIFVKMGSKVGDDGGDGDGRIFPSHPGPIPNALRDQISRKGPLTPTKHIEGALRGNLQPRRKATSAL